MNRAISLPQGSRLASLVPALPFANARDTNKTAPQTFVSEASAAGVAEIEAGKMALEKSTAADVKVFAKQMIDDHGKGQRRTAQPGRAQETGGRRRRQPDRQGQGDPARPARRLLRPGLRQ
ncbi:DUF4142 domain-containing protein [Pseudomonas aeruginosa]|nr:DUF4142 domain-containing protein [Pseudomonas aeruginosa]